MNDPIDLYRQIRAAQKQAERTGFSGTATALATVAEMIALEAGGGETGGRVAVIGQVLAPTPSPVPGALPIYRMAQC